MTVISPDSVFRDYNTDGVPSSGAFGPRKSDIRKLLGSGLVRTPQWYGAVGDGSTDDAVALQPWLDAIPTNGSGFIPEAPGGYYKCGTALTHSGRIAISGCGLASRVHYTGSGVALTLSLARFTRMENWYLTGTSSAAGGCYVKSAQQGFSSVGWFVEGFSGVGAYAIRFSSCWTLHMLGGRANGSVGIWLDTTNDTVAALNNSINLIQVDCSGCSVTGSIFSPASWPTLSAVISRRPELALKLGAGSPVPIWRATSTSSAIISRARTASTLGVAIRRQPSQLHQDRHQLSRWCDELHSYLRGGFCDIQSPNHGRREHHRRRRHRHAVGNREQRHR